MRTLFLTILFQFTVTSLFCQSELIKKSENKQVGSIFRINKIIPNEKDKSLYIYLTATYRDTAKFFKGNAKYFTVKELKKSPSTPLEIRLSNQKLNSENLLNDQRIVDKPEQSTLLVLIDFSGSMLEEKGLKLQKAKEALHELLVNPKLKSVNKKFAIFHNSIGKTFPLNEENFIIISKRKAQYDTDLNRSIEYKLNELSTIKGNKMLILLTDGQNDPNNEYYKRFNLESEIVSDKKVYNIVSNLDSSFQIISIGIGKNADKSFLDSLSKCTTNPYDFCLFDTEPDQVPAALKFTSESMLSNLVLRVFPDPNHCIFGNETREFQVTYKRDSNNIFIAIPHAAKFCALSKS